MEVTRKLIRTLLPFPRIEIQNKISSGEKAVGTPLLPTPVFALISLALLTYYGWVILAARSWHDDGPQPLAMEKKTA